MTPAQIRAVYEKAVAEMVRSDSRVCEDHALIAVFNAGRQHEREVQETFSGVS